MKTDGWRPFLKHDMMIMVLTGGNLLGSLKTTINSISKHCTSFYILSLDLIFVSKYHIYNINP
jgi:hypothetical protein